MKDISPLNVARIRVLCSGIAMLGLFLGCGARQTSDSQGAARLEAEWERCKQNEKLKNAQWVESCYGRLCDSPAPDSLPKACLSRVKWLFKNEEDAKARDLSVKFIEQHSNSAHAQSAVKKLTSSFLIQEQAAEGVNVLQNLARKVKDSEVHDTVLFALARLYRELGQPRDEEKTLRIITEVYNRWDSQLYDDAVWRLCQLLAAEQRTDEESTLLQGLLGSRETSLIIGSYNSPYFDDALLRLGQIAFEKDRYERANKYFMELSKIESSRLRDDALLWAARTWFAAGHGTKGCELLERVRNIPGASAGKEAVELAKSRGCR